MHMLNPQTAAALLRGQGVRPERLIEQILDGFDFSKPAYAHDFWPGDVLYQLMRLPSAAQPFMATGNWFGLAGITTSGVAINDGLSGRQAVRFEVIAPFTALEGTARALPADLGTAIGGRGGATQIYIPKALLGHLQALGHVERWEARPR